MYSFDLSYFINTEIQDSDIYNIVNKYPSCEWYASDIGPFGGKTRKQRNNGYQISNINEFKNLIKEVNESTGIFFDFVVKYHNKDDDNCYDIYRSPSFYDRMSDRFKKEYNDSIENLEDDDLEIYTLIKERL